PSGFFSAIFVFANDPLYPSYELARGAEALVDQRIGGLIMKLGGTLVLWTILSVKFIRWLNQRPDAHPASPRPPL
ncbi:MAG: cytochrome c oxidase assembly protein, partial [Chloroflexi bacterium]|nr:cytochrome c oxidase assembly protein [Chloroflexota bacterium]